MCGGERHTICKSRDGTELKTFEESRRGSQKKMSRIMYKVGFFVENFKKKKDVCVIVSKKKKYEASSNPNKNGGRGATLSTSSGVGAHCAQRETIPLSDKKFLFQGRRVD